MVINNPDEFYIFLEKNPFSNTEGFVDMYNIVNRFCKNCRKSEYAQALEELNTKYEYTVRMISKDLEQFSKDKESLYFYSKGILFLHCNL